jgi:bifunctional oligoribonuclease and PAP phosphatase NrnA
MDIIKNAKHVLLHLHPKPDPDSVGSALATYHALRSIGKEVTVIKGDSELSPIFSFLPGYNEIVKKNFFEIDLADFDLFIIQDSASTQLISRKGEVVFPPHLRTLVIDHHITNTKFAETNLVDASYSATAEYLFDLFTEWGISIDTNIAQCLYVGIYGDTGGFKYPNTTLRTMRIVGKLAEIYPNFSELITKLETNNPPEKIYFDALALSNIEVVDSHIAISCVSYAQLQEKGITAEQIDNNTVASTLVTVAQWKVGITLIEKEPNKVAVSFRSKDGTDVSAFAQALGGGGHKPAAGAYVSGSLEEVKKKVLSVIHS